MVQGSGAELALERAFPALRGHVPRVVLTDLPTRVHRLPALSAAVGTADIWVKRDDESGRLYGGNKPRKLEFVLADALAAGKRSVLTFGGIGTHHGLATAICARAVGLRAILLLLKQPVTEHVRRGLLLDLAAGAELHYAPTVARLGARTLRVCAREIARGQAPYVVPAGGSSAHGVVGYVNAALELREQIQAGALPEPAWIFVALGTGGTVAGLVAGLRLAELRSRVAAVLVTDIRPPTPTSLARMGTKSWSLVRRWAPGLPDLTLAAGDFRILESSLGAGYGAPTEAARQARDTLERLEGLHLETTYTAKCVAGMLEALRSGEHDGGPVLFWHTYSSAAPTSHLGPLPEYQRLPRVFHQFFTGTPLPD
jgi:D-cysteine desulfhydrase